MVCLRMHPRSKNWSIWIPGGCGKIGFYRSLNTPDRATAEAILAKRKDEIVDTANLQKADALSKQLWGRVVYGKSVTVADALREYQAHQTLVGLSVSTIDSTLRRLERWFRTMRISREMIGAITPQHVANYVNNPRSGMSLITRTS